MSIQTLDKLKIFKERSSIFHSKKADYSYWKKENHILKRRQKIVELETNLVAMNNRKLHRLFSL